METSALDAAQVGGASGLMGVFTVSFDQIVRDAAPGVVAATGGQDYKAHYTPYAAPTVTSAADRAMVLRARQREEYPYASGAGQVGGFLVGAALVIFAFGPSRRRAAFALLACLVVRALGG